MAISNSFISALNRRTAPTDIPGGGGLASSMSSSARSAGMRRFSAAPAPDYGPDSRVPGITAASMSPASYQSQQIAETPLYQQLFQGAQQQLALGGSLSNQDARNADQQARAAMAARGMALGPGAVSSELLNRDAVSRVRLGERQNFASGVEQLGQVIRLANAGSENQARSSNAGWQQQAGLANAGFNMEAQQQNQNAILQQILQGRSLTAAAADAAANRKAQSQSQSRSISAEADDWLRNAKESRAIRDYNFGISNEADRVGEAERKRKERALAMQEAYRGMSTFSDSIQSSRFSKPRSPLTGIRGY